MGMGGRERQDTFQLISPYIIICGVVYLFSNYPCRVSCTYLPIHSVQADKSSTNEFRNNRSE